MTQKEKAKAYDEAKARMSKAYNSNRCTIGFMNEIFPELKKSKDEIIREEIIDFLSLPHPQFVGKRDHKEWIAWLEKQGEQKQKAHNICDTCVRQTTCKSDCFMQLCEQKPAWSEEDSPYYDDICEILMNILHSEIHNYNKDAIKKDLDWFKSLKERVQPQLKHEWSDEDYIMQRAALEILMASPKTVASTILKESVIVWLQSIKDRVQPKQEWSEEDEHWRQKAIDFMKHPDLIKATPTLSKDVIDWLKFLKDRVYPSSCAEGKVTTIYNNRNKNQ